MPYNHNPDEIDHYINDGKPMPLGCNEHLNNSDLYWLGSLKVVPPTKSIKFIVLADPSETSRDLDQLTSSETYAFSGQFVVGTYDSNKKLTFKLYKCTFDNIKAN